VEEKGGGSWQKHVTPKSGGIAEPRPERDLSFKAKYGGTFLGKEREKVRSTLLGSKISLPPP
jgi:hypothetical protein